MTEPAAFHLLEATIDGIHTAMRMGQITSRQLVGWYLDRIHAYDKNRPALNAIQTLNPSALAEAEALDAKLATTGMIGPLHGIPVLVKDQVETEGLLTTYGSALFAESVPERDATVVARLKAAGAIVLAKTTMGEFAQNWAGSAFGVCRTPYDPTRNPAGSSCGTGAGLAANFAAIGIGEDSGGSIRGPAAFNNLVGLRPTLPLVSRYGMMPALPTRDTLGPMARTVRDAALLLDVIAGYDPNDPITAASVGHVPPTYTSFLNADGLRGVRLGVLREPMAADAKPEAEDYQRVRAVIDRALVDMAAQGAMIVDPLPMPGLIERLRRVSGSYETETAIGAYLAELPGAPVKTLREIVLSSAVLPSRRTRFMDDIGRTTNDPGYLRELLTREELRQMILQAMADQELDALVYATFDHEPILIPDDVMTRRSPATQPGNNRVLSPLLGFPAIAIPAGFTSQGLPVGVELLGRPFTEGLLFQMAYAYEQATHHRQSPRITPALHGAP